MREKGSYFIHKGKLYKVVKVIDETHTLNEWEYLAVECSHESGEEINGEIRRLKKDPTIYDTKRRFKGIAKGKEQMFIDFE